MRIETNTKLMKRNRQIATNLFLVTFLVLIGGFFFVNVNLFTQTEANDPLLLLAQSAVLPIAFILTLISIRMTNNWARRPYPEEVINESLKGLSNKSVVYHYHHLPARHVLVCPQGIFAITTRWHMGKYSVTQGRWRTRASFIARFFSSLRMDGIGDPTYEAQRAAAHIQKLLAANQTSQDTVPEVKPLILFVDPRAQVEADESAVPILFNDTKRPNLTEHLRELARTQQPGESNKKKGAAMPLTDAQIERFEATTLKKAK